MPPVYNPRAAVVIALIFALCGIFPGVTSATVWIHEFMASNGETVADEDGDFEDWIELQNFGAEAVALDGWGLSDNAENPFKWVFPEGTVLEAGGFLLVWASGKDRSGRTEEEGVAAIMPGELDGLVLHLRAADVDTSDGTAVSMWTDRSSGTNHAFQPNQARRPTYQANALYGSAALRFDRSAAQQFFLPPADFVGMEDFSSFTYLAVARWTGGVRSGLMGGFRGSNLANSGSVVFEVSESDGSLRLRLPPSLDLQAPGALTQDKWHIIGAIMDADSARAGVMTDGVVLAEAEGEVGRTVLADFERLPVGSSHDDSRTFGGDLAEVILFNRALSAEEQAALERYLELLYGLGPTPPQPHTNFRISAAGEELLLTRPDGSLADYVMPVAVPRDVSYGRTPGDPQVWAFFYEPTPGAPNTSPGLSSPVEAVVFSHSPGNHSEAFDLTLSHADPEATLVYTIDGSEPDIENLGGTTYAYVNSYPGGQFRENTFTTAVYSTPIRISDRSGQPDKLARISSTADASPAYFPTAPVKKGTVVRARAYRNGAPGPVTTATYFVSPTNTFSWDIPLVSVSTNEDGLFDFFTGIYVAGVDHATGSGARICNWGNYNRRGRENERAAHIEFFADGRRFLQQSAGIRIQGNCSRMRPFKSLRLYGRSEGMDGGLFDFPLFSEPVADALYPENTLHRRLILRSPNFYDTAFSRLFHGVYEGVAGRLQPVKQFINGEYWGVAFLRDRFDPYYLEHHYGLDPDNVAIIGVSYRHEFEPIPVNYSDRVYTLSSGIEQDLDDFEAMRAFIIGNNMADPALYAEAQMWICMNSFVDHLILKIFAGDAQYAPEVVYWRTRTAEDNHFGDARWRFFVKDFDSSLQTANYVTGLAEGTHPRPFGHKLFTSLLDSPEFRRLFINRFSDLLNTSFRTERFESIIRASYEEMAPIWPEMAARWRNAEVSNPDRPFTPEYLSNLILWARQHPTRQRSHLRSHFGLETERPLTVQVSHYERGRIRVNRILLDEATPGLSTQPYPWTGVYYPGYPVTLTAVPLEGYRFVEWQVWESGAPEPTRHSTVVLEVDLDVPLSVEAVFAPMPPAFLEVSAGSVLELNPGEWLPAEADSLTFSAYSRNDDVLTATMEGGVLRLTGLSAGEAEVMLLRSSGDLPAEPLHVLRALVYAAPFLLADGTYAFERWDAQNPAMTFPPHMLFTQSDTTDPDLATPLLFAYGIPAEDARDPADVDLPYAASQRTRINGLGEEGIRFINTGRGRDLGAAVLSLDTVGVTDIRVAWTAGTDLPNTRVYGLQLQYRIGLEGPWLDVTDAVGNPVGYVRNEVQGHEVRIGPTTLPPEVEDKPLVQLRWKYHHISGTNGPRAALRLDDVVVYTDSPTRFADWLMRELPDPALRTDPDYAGPFADPSGEGFPNLLRYALGLGIMERPDVREPRLQWIEDGVLVYRFPFNPKLTDIAYRVVASENLVDWDTVLFDSGLETASPSAEDWLAIPINPMLDQYVRLLVIPIAD